MKLIFAQFGAAAILAVASPAVAAEWHPTRNGTLTPRDVGPGSHARVWWRCVRHQSHQWQIDIRQRVKHRLPCPFCSGRRATAYTSLAAKFPALARQWHPAKNGELKSLLETGLTLFREHQMHAEELAKGLK